MLPLLATLLVATQAGPMPIDSSSAARVPAIQISLNNDGNYAPGGPVDVRVQTTDDGYLVVFRVDGDGHVRMLFPLDPDGDPFVRGGKQYEVRGRDEGQAFFADDRAGNGMVYAAISHQPYTFHDFVANGHWDYEALRLSDSSTDAETDLTAIVARMTDRARFDYDALAYRVQEIGTVTAAAGDGYYPGFYDPEYNPRWRCLGCGWAYPGADFSLGLDFGYSPYYDPWLFSPWAYGYTNFYGFGGFGFPGFFPVHVSRPFNRLPPVARPRPRPGMIAGNRAIGSAPIGANIGTRARPRPPGMVVNPRMSGGMVRPSFRQPPQGAYSPGQRARPETQEARPAYREPPRSSPPPRSAPSARSAPSGHSGGSGGGHGGGRH